MFKEKTFACTFKRCVNVHLLYSFNLQEWEYHQASKQHWLASLATFSKFLNKIILSLEFYKQIN